MPQPESSPRRRYSVRFDIDLKTSTAQFIWEGEANDDQQAKLKATREFMQMAQVADEPVTVMRMR